MGLAAHLVLEYKMKSHHDKISTKLTPCVSVFPPVSWSMYVYIKDRAPIVLMYFKSNVLFYKYRRVYGDNIKYSVYIKRSNITSLFS